MGVVCNRGCVTIGENGKLNEINDLAVRGCSGYMGFIGSLRRNRGFEGIRVKNTPINYTDTKTAMYHIAIF